MIRRTGWKSEKTIPTIFIIGVLSVLFLGSCSKEPETIGPNHCIVHVYDIVSFPNNSTDIVIQMIANRTGIKEGTILKTNIVQIVGHPYEDNDINKGDIVYIATRQKELSKTKYMVFNHYSDKEGWFTHTW